MRWCWLALLVAGCHVTTRHDTVRVQRTERLRRDDGARARPATVVVSADGTLRFVEPLECPTDQLVIEQRGSETVTRANLATFVIGVIATSAGAIALTSGAGKGSAPLTYGGGAALAAGVPLAIGPWIGNGTTRDDAAALPRTRRQPGPFEACGERPLVASSAQLRMRGVDVFGTIASDGTFAVSPYELVDAFVTTRVPPLDLTGTVTTPRGSQRVEVIIDSGTLASRAPAFLRQAAFDTTIEPIRLVPNLVPGTLRVSLAEVRGQPVLRVVLSVENTGPGPAYAVRGYLTATGQPAIDGRILYVGRVDKGETVTRELHIPLAPAAAEALRNANVEVMLELRDAHGTAPATPVFFRGIVLGDAPR